MVSATPGRVPKGNTGARLPGGDRERSSGPLPPSRPPFLAEDLHGTQRRVQQDFTFSPPLPYIQWPLVPGHAFSVQVKTPIDVSREMRLYQRQRIFASSGSIDCR